MVRPESLCFWAAVGTWTISHNSGAAGTEWGTVSWSSSEPGDSSITVQAASSADGVTYGALQAVTDSVDLTVGNGQYLKVVVSFVRSSTDADGDGDGDGFNDSPILFDLTINAARGDVDPPRCEVIGINASGQLEVEIEDSGSGIQTIDVLVASNASVNIPAFTPGITSTITAVATKINTSKRARVELKATDAAGNVSTCDPEIISLSATDFDGGTAIESVFGFPDADQFVTFYNGGGSSARGPGGQRQRCLVPDTSRLHHHRHWLRPERRHGQHPHSLGMGSRGRSPGERRSTQLTFEG